jgi:adenine phosphoribosyltransferase
VPVDPDLKRQLRSTFRWRGDRTDHSSLADVSGWWRDPHVLRSLGPGLASLFDGERPSAVVGIQSSGTMLGALVAQHLGVGLAAVLKDPSRAADSDRWWEVSTGPDYRDRSLRLGIRRSLLQSGDRVLFVDDWIATGAQAEAAHALVEMAGATWIGAAVVVDGLERTPLRRALNLRALVSLREL